MLTYLSNKMPFGAGPGSNPAREVLKLLAIGLSVVFLGCTDGSGPASGDRAASGDVIHPVRSGTDVTRGIAAPGPVRDDLFGSLPIIDSMIPMATECCTEPGQLTECWIQDAEDDGITCATDDDCDSGDCNTSLGVCTCTSDAECAEGVCTPSQICGPQYCNGFRQCSCFGGCETSNPDLPPADVCSSNGLVCCNGNYPLHPEVRGESFGEIGFCSTDSDCLLVSCEADEDCPDDGDACTSERCNVGTGSCMHILDGAACDDDNVCTEDVCDQVDGCIHTPLTGPCDDGNECTENETCDSGFCVGTVTECDDGNVCTEDSCDDAIGCVYFNNTDACDDGDACTIGDICADGVCDGAARECDDGNDCTDDVCDAAAGCLYTDVVGGCDDGDACTEGDVCVSGLCQSGGPLDCDDGNVCTDDACDNAAGCVYVNNTGACSDNNACTDGDVCADGVCASGAVITCDDGNQCTTDTCNSASGCVFTNTTAACDDGNACTENDVCVDGACVGDAVDCDDDNICTDDSCDPAVGCQNDYSSNTVPCDDYNVCTADDRCSDGECGGIVVHWRFEEEGHDGHSGDVKDHAGLYPATSENDVSETDGPVGGAIRFGTGTGSNVGNAATGYHVNDDASTIAFWVKFDEVYGDHQAIGAFSGAGKRFYLGIDRDNNIMAGYGNKFVGWSHPSVPSTIEPGEWVRMVLTFDGEMAHVYVNDVLLISFETSFNSGGQGPEFFLGTNNGNVEIDEVVIDEKSWDAEDVSLDYDDGDGPDPYRYTINCDDGNPCTDDTCEAAVGCVNTPIAHSCSDGDACTINDTCSGGVCGGDAVVCDDGDRCTTDTCDPDTGCVFVQNTLSCDDGDPCTEGDVCGGGTCAGTPRSCDDGNPCTDESCVAGVGCVYTDNAQVCDDNNACTENDACADGLCQGTIISCNDGDPCTADTCSPATGCNSTLMNPCPLCSNDADCDLLITCLPQPAGCSEPVCMVGVCACDPVAAGTPCTDYLVPDFPENSYEGLCDGFGTCTPMLIEAENNLCSDLFDPMDTNALDTSQIGYLGAIPTDGTTLAVTGSTIGANNNYFSGGAACEENGSGDPIGIDANDALHAFAYQVNGASEYTRSAYVVKVEADFDVAVYVAPSVASADDCPEGDAPDQDEHAQTFLEAASQRCNLPYASLPMPPTVEETCADDGNLFYDQECCDPCAAGDDCGYKWCERGYNTDGSPCDLCGGTCDASWLAPDAPFDCDATVPGDPGYDDYNYVVTTVLYPEGAADGSFRNALLVVDGVDGAQGNYYLTVEKVSWLASPIDRANDAARIYDITDIAAGGETFLGTLEGAVNSYHACEGSCGEYGCACGFDGVSSCHDGVAPGEHWPNQEYYKIHRSADDGAGTYCIRTDESVGGSADLVVTVRQQSGAGVAVSDDNFTESACGHDDIGGDVQLEITAAADTLYLVEVSQFSSLGRPCAGSDDCRYKLIVDEGPCPASCVDFSTWFPDNLEGTFTVNGAGLGFSPSGLVSGSTNGAANNYMPDAGWAGGDELWRINVSQDATVTFSGCGDFGFDGRTAIFDCEGAMVARDDNGCGDTSPVFAAELEVNNQPYYLLIDSFDAKEKGVYGITMGY